jgi:hypothetical protein
MVKLFGHWWSSPATSDSLAPAKEEGSVERDGGITEWGEQDVGQDLRDKWRDRNCFMLRSRLVTGILKSQVKRTS